MLSRIFKITSARVFIGHVLIAAACGAATLPKRTALVVGNGRYETTVGALRNTRNDAKAVAVTLRGLGFTVIEKHDLTRDQLLRAVDDFRRTLPGAEIALFYYAGHGLSVAGANYLIPLKSGFDAAGADATTLRMRAETHLFNAEQAVADMGGAGAGCNLVILDACRTTPVARDGLTRDTNPRGGLAEMTPPANSLIAFAADAGQTAFDGDGANGLYTEELLKQLRTPGLTIEQVFKRTRARVLSRSGGGQLPAEYSRLVGEDIYLAGPVAAPMPEPVAKPRVEKAEAVAPPTLAEISKLAADGKTTECITGLRVVTRARGVGEFAVGPLDALLEGVKDDLKGATAPSPRVIAAVATCETVLNALPDCLPPGSTAAKELAAKAHNRRGDALLLLGRARDAMAEFNAAAPLAPDDPYVLYNRGRANLALGLVDEARADFKSAADPRFDKPNARKLAEQALVDLK